MSLWNPTTWFDHGNPIDPWVTDFQFYMEDAGLPIRIAQVRRTQAEQQRLYAQGRDAPGPIVTWTLRSKHITGEAFDFDFVSGDDNNDPEAWAFAGEVGRGLGLHWGGDWDVQDLRHFELPAV